MTNEEKQLLLIDLCARLPYGVTYYHDTENVVTPKQVLSLTEINNILLGIGDNIKPYLRPVSSMTAEEYCNLCCSCTWLWHEDDLKTITQGDYKCYDWLDAHHFDYRGLIPMGLALEAPKDMYKTEQI